MAAVPRHKFWPYLMLNIELPFFRVNTTVNYENMNMMVHEYVSLYIKVWKYETYFRLYQLDRNR